MPVQFASKSASGNVVTVNVSNTDPEPVSVMVSIRVKVSGQLTTLTSEWTGIGAETTGPVHLQASGPVEFTADQPEPTIVVQST